jgi:hypothetical protein
VKVLCPFKHLDLEKILERTEGPEKVKRIWGGYVNGYGFCAGGPRILTGAG